MRTRMRRTGAALAIAGLLGGCATVPTGPAVPAYPGTSRTAEQFVQDDASCRALAQSAFASGAAQPANDAAAANVVGGTLLGAAVGALLGAAVGEAGHGAAIGAGVGALGGGAAAADVSGYSNAQMQSIYDRTYLQCMFGRGHRVPAPFAQRSYRVPYAVPQAGAGVAGYPPPNTPPPRTTYPPPSTAAPPGGYPPPDAAPPARNFVPAPRATPPRTTYAPPSNVPPPAGYPPRDAPPPGN